MAVAISTVEKFINDLRKMNGRKREHRLVMINAMPYAVHLHRRKGFFVFNDGHLANIVHATLRKAIRQGVPLFEKNRKLALEASAIKEKNWLTSVTSELRPPAHPGEGRRRAHPGHWADVRSHLVRAYYHEIDGKAKGKKSATRYANR